MKKQELEELSGTVSIVSASSDIDGLLAYMARVSNPDNQNNPNIKGLLNHMMQEGHVSPFDMCNVVFEINTTRDIGRQLLRHWSIKPQEFSQRYQTVDKLGAFVLREFREQDTKNRQASIEVADDDPRAVEWLERQKRLFTLVQADYDWMISVGGAKEQARVILPEGCTRTKMYFNGTLRSWVHYIGERKKNATQKEHRKIAREVLKLLRTVAPVTMEAFFPETPSAEDVGQVILPTPTVSSGGAKTYDVVPGGALIIFPTGTRPELLDSLAAHDGLHTSETIEEGFKFRASSREADIYLKHPLLRADVGKLWTELVNRSGKGQFTAVFAIAGYGW